MGYEIDSSDGKTGPGTAQEGPQPQSNGAADDGIREEDLSRHGSAHPCEGAARVGSSPCRPGARATGAYHGDCGCCRRECEGTAGIDVLRRRDVAVRGTGIDETVVGFRIAGCPAGPQPHGGCAADWDHRCGIREFQALYFAVYGYGALQMMDMGLKKAPAFHPDVYIVQLLQTWSLSATPAGVRTSGD